ncbi:MAG: helix-turn-helix domain-containing protein [Candidatus Zixiibacteriota bacterium]
MTRRELHNKIGLLLKLERERQNLTWEDLSAQLKISKRNLEHIEAGNADALPSELYFNLFAKSYAEMLGIDYSRTVEAIKEEVGEPLEPQGHVEHRKEFAADSTKPVVRPNGQKINEGPLSNTKYLKTWVFMFAVVVVLFFFFLIVTRIFAFSNESVSLTVELTKELVGGTKSIDEERAAEADFTGFDCNVSLYRLQSDLRLNLQPVDWRDSISGYISPVTVDRSNSDSFLSSHTDPLIRSGWER